LSRNIGVGSFRPRCSLFASQWKQASSRQARLLGSVGFLSTSGAHKPSSRHMSVRAARDVAGAHQSRPGAGHKSITAHSLISSDRTRARSGVSVEEARGSLICSLFFGVAVFDLPTKHSSKIGVCPRRRGTSATSASSSVAYRMEFASPVHARPASTAAIEADARTAK
jgi:hypothetical protein